jgi:deltex
MTVKNLPDKLSGFSDRLSDGTFEITYSFGPGQQGPLNSNPGKPYTGMKRQAYLPINAQGKHVLKLMQRAFDDQHMFTIGCSATTGLNNVIIWDGIHHKTSMSGGSNKYCRPSFRLLVVHSLDNSRSMFFV